MDLKHEITKYTLGLQAFQTVVKMVVKSYRQFSINGPIHSRVSGVKEPSKLELLNCPKRVGDVIRPKSRDICHYFYTLDMFIFRNTSSQKVLKQFVNHYNFLRIHTRDMSRQLCLIKRKVGPRK